METRPEKSWLSVVLPDELKRWVRVEAAHRDMSASAYVRELVERERRAEPSAARPKHIRGASIKVSDRIGARRSSERGSSLAP